MSWCVPTCTRTSLCVGSPRSWVREVIPCVFKSATRHTCFCRHTVDTTGRRPRSGFPKRHTLRLCFLVLSKAGIYIFGLSPVCPATARRGVGFPTRQELG